MIAISIVALAAFTIVSLAYEEKKAKAGQRESGSMLTELLSHDLAAGVIAKKQELLQESVGRVINMKDVASISVFNVDMKVLYSRSKSPSSQSGGPRALLNASNPVAAVAITIFETPVGFEFAMPIISDALLKRGDQLSPDTAVAGTKGRTVGYVSLVLSKGAYAQEIRTLIAQQAAVMLAFIFCGSAIVAVAIKRAATPFEKLTEKVTVFEKDPAVAPLPAEAGDEAGNLKAMAVERKQAEDSLRESEERYRRLVKLSPDAIYVQQDERIVFLNAACARLMGDAGPSQVLGRRMEDFVHEEDCANLRSLFRQVEEKGVITPLIPIRYRRLDGAVVATAAAVAPFRFNNSRAVLVIVRDETERKDMEEKIGLYREELLSAARELSSIEARTEERERHLIAADLHDYVSQNLVVCHFKLGGLRKALASPESIRQLEDVRELIAETTQYTRSLTIELCPPILAELGLTAAVEALAEEFEKTHSIRISVHDDHLPKELDDDTRYLLFRCVRELLVNVVKHAQADRVNISFAADAKAMRLTIADDGRGFDAAAVTGKQHGFGLYSIRERLKRIHGSCEIESRPKAGTTVVLTALLKA